MDGETDVSVCGDGDLLVSLFVNLLDNGAKASGPGQTVQAVIRDRQVVIRDSGKGMTRAELDRIREPFYRADRSGQEGIGLGLAICEQITRLHGAELSFESRAGEGTTVTVSFCPTEAYKTFTGR